MYKIISFLLLIFVGTLVGISQIPKTFNYQAVVRDIDGVVIANKDISLKIDIVEGLDINNLLYSEKHDIRTDNLGYIRLKVGKGILVNGNFNEIDWSKGNYNLQISFKEIGAEEYQVLNIVPLLSVPYALYAERAGNTDDADMDSTNELQTVSISNDTIYLTEGGFAKLPETDRDSTNELQTISISNDTIYLSKGGNITLPAVDTSNTNELQALSISNDTVYLTNGGFVKLPAVASGDFDTDNSNELQILSISNDTIFLSDGDLIKLPPVTAGDFDADSTNELQILTLSNDTLYLSKGNYVVLTDSNGFWSQNLSALYYNSGNVGIGTTQPETKLHISDGDILIDNPDNGIILTSPNGMHWKLTVNNDGSLNVDTMLYTLILQPGAEEGKDASAHTYFPNQNFGQSNELRALSWTISSDPYTIRFVIDFDLSDLPSNAVVKSAKLLLFQYHLDGEISDGHSQHTGSNAAYIRRVTSSWDESTITWNNQPTYTTTNEVVLPASDSVDQDYIINISPLIQDIIDNPSTSFGVIIMLQNETPYKSLLFASSDNADSNLHPKLEIVYYIKP